jgi:haloalkane dehalogenase
LDLSLKSLTLDAGTVAFFDEGQGQPVVLLHGAPLTALGFLRVIRELRRHYRVIAPDLPGFGYSEPRSSFPGTLGAYAQVVEELCCRLELRDMVVFVNDASGSFGLRAAARMADRVAGLVVADTVSLPLSGGAWWVKQVLKYVVASPLVRFVNRRWNLLPWLVVSVAPWLRRFRREERKLLVQQFDTEAKRERVIDVSEHLARDDAFIADTVAAIRAHLEAKPTLLLYGQLDPMRMTGAVGRFERMFARSSVRIIPWEEHFPILASGQRVAEVVHQWILTDGAKMNG